MRRVVSLFLPYLPTERLRRKRGKPPPEDWPPLATTLTVSSRRMIVSPDARALSLGVLPGMTVTKARGLVPDLEVVDADPEADRDALRKLALWAGRRYSPQVAPDPPAGIWLDITGCEGLFGGEEPLAKDLYRRIRASGLTPHIGIADTAGCAHAVARQVRSGRPVHIAPGRTAEALGLLPVSALRIEPAVAADLARMGFTRIEELMGAPRGPLAKRFGRELYRRLDQALGTRPEPIEAIFAEEMPCAVRHLLEPIGTPEAFAQVIDDLVHDLVSQLLRKGAGVRRLDLMFKRVDGVLQPDPARAVLRPFTPAADPPGYEAPGSSRAQRIADRVLALTDREVTDQLRHLLAEFADRHRDLAELFLRRFDQVNGLLIARCEVGRDRAILIGSYFCAEYSYEAAALFNPSIVPHPDQSDLDEHCIRFVLSLRAVGEGHISSIAFRTGTCTADGVLKIDAPKPRPTLLQTTFPLEGTDQEPAVRIVCDGTHDLSEVVIFPLTAAQERGVEDLRLVRFIEEDGSAMYYGTYTAFSDQGIRQELLRTADFRTFDMIPLRGPATASKGMALFPRRVQGQYAMLGRHDNENILFLRSPELDHWAGGETIVRPRWPWEFVQIGNCGSPLEIDEGCLVITHGVGPLRNYSIGACLLDRDDPTRLLARTTEPLLRPDRTERAGYVPNVMYTCGALIHGRTLVLPYAVADSFTTFAALSLDDLVGAME